MDNLYKKLTDYSRLDYYPFHMPGHKRQMEAYPMKHCYQIDISEIEGFDSLHHAEGILAEAMERAARLYRSDQTFFLVNGSTCGILAALSAAVSRGGKVLFARNSHKAAYHALFLRELHPVYLYPQMEETYHILGGIEPQEVAEALERNQDIEAVYITSPTYEGIVTDIETIAEIAHKKGIPLIVDEAHGAHFGFHPAFPQSAVQQGADIVIHSIHKTLPAMTQTALLHVNGRLADREKVRKYLDIYQSSSPSYVLMAGIEECMAVIEEEGTFLFTRLKGNLEEFYQTCRGLKRLRVMGQEVIGQAGTKEIDRGKILISTEKTSIHGRELYQRLLHPYHLQMEMAAENYVLGIAAVMDRKEGFHRLADALFEIDKVLEDSSRDICIPGTEAARFGMEIYEAEESRTEQVNLCDSINRISGEYIYLYPPGIPLIVPGEIIQKTTITLIEEYRKQGLLVQGPADYKMLKIKVIKGY